MEMIDYEVPMNNMRTSFHAFSEADMKAFESETKAGVLATINEEGFPHLTLITTLQASTPTEVIWGQFTEGLSKQFIKMNPRTAFLIMTPDKELWRGKANFTRVEKQGKEFDMYNNKPMFRYNAYMGLHTVYYMDLVEHSGKEILPYASILKAFIKTLVSKTISRKKRNENVLNSWSLKLINRMSNPKFISYIGEDGYPNIIPVIQLMTLDSQHVIFSISVYKEELKNIPNNTPVAVFCMSPSMEDLLIRGTFRIKRIAGIKSGIIKVKWIYNSMPPKPQQIYPELDVESVTSF